MLEMGGTEVGGKLELDPGFIGIFCIMGLAGLPKLPGLPIMP